MLALIHTNHHPLHLSQLLLLCYAKSNLYIPCHPALLHTFIIFKSYFTLKKGESLTSYQYNRLQLLKKNLYWGRATRFYCPMSHQVSTPRYLNIPSHHILPALLHPGANASLTHYIIHSLLNTTIHTAAKVQKLRNFKMTGKPKRQLIQLKGEERASLAFENSG